VTVLTSDAGDCELLLVFFLGEVVPTVLSGCGVVGVVGVVGLVEIVEPIL
jgi:hypothetical protein